MASHNNPEQSKPVHVWRVEQLEAWIRATKNLSVHARLRSDHNDVLLTSDDPKGWNQSELKSFNGKIDFSRTVTVGIGMVGDGRSLISKPIAEAMCYAVHATLQHNFTPEEAIALDAAKQVLMYKAVKYMPDTKGLVTLSPTDTRDVIQAFNRAEKEGKRGL